jgi:hypothetical protein
MWNITAKVRPVIIRATGTVSRAFRKHLSSIAGKWDINELHAVLQTLRKVLISKYFTSESSITCTRTITRNHNVHVQDDQKVSVHLMITVQKHPRKDIFYQFQSLTKITQFELEITDGVSVSLVSPWPRRLAAKEVEPSREYLLLSVL